MKEYYSKIKDKVLRARQNFYKYANDLPKPLNKLAIKYMTYRNGRTISGGPMGELYAFWLGEPFCLREDILQKAALGSISGSMYFIIQDDLIDDPNEDINIQIYLLNNFLYSKMIESFYIVANQDSNFWFYLNKYLKEYSIGYKWQENKKLSKLKLIENKPLLKKDLYMAAYRSAPVKICMSAIMLSIKRVDLINIIEKAIDNLLIGLQIRDDITDWKEDLKNGYFTYPINALLSNEINKKRFKLTGNLNLKDLKKRIELAFLFTDELEKLLEESNSFLDKSKRVTQKLRMESLNSYINYIITENKKVKKEIISKKVDFINRKNYDSINPNL